MPNTQESAHDVGGLVADEAALFAVHQQRRGAAAAEARLAQLVHLPASMSM